MSELSASVVTLCVVPSCSTKRALQTGGAGDRAESGGGCRSEVTGHYKRQM